MLIVKHKWDDESVNWLEEDMQAACVTVLRRVEKHFKNKGLQEFTFAGDQNGGKRSHIAATKAKACGIREGETDLRFYLPNRTFKMIELKRLKKGRISPEQLERHRTFERLGFEAQVVFAKTPMNAAKEVLWILTKWMNYETAEVMAIAFPAGGSHVKN